MFGFAEGICFDKEFCKFMVTWKRGFLEIVGEMLQGLMEQPMKKTHITCKCNLDSRAVTKYLHVMMANNLVRQTAQTNPHYEITQKGIRYLKQYTALVDMMQTA